MEAAASKSKVARVAASASVPGVSGVGSGRGCISELPDGVLGAILSLLPLKEAGCTATRWSSVFACSPIALDDEHVGRRRLGRPAAENILHAERMAAITSALAAHTGPIPRVRLAKTDFQGAGDCDGASLGAEAFASRRVEELIVHSTHSFQFFPAPPLRSLHQVTIGDAPKLKILGFLSMKFHLVDYNAVYKGMHLAVSSPIRCVKTLALCVNLCDVAQLRQILQFLNYFPSLEKLHIKNFSQLLEDFWIPELPYASYLELAASVACLKYSVKTIVLSRYLGTEPELQFAKILLGSARVLKAMHGVYLLS